MAKSLDAWIHNFTVTDCATHKKGYTVYKIKSIVFPVFIPETLTCVTVWKRYNDVKKLRKHVAQRHKQLQLRGHVPEHHDDGFFRRFDADVVQARKEHILRLLDFIAQHPALYKCHAFVQFFEASHTTPSVSPLRRRPSTNIATICGEIAVPFSADYKLIDPERDKDQSDTDDDVGTPSVAIAKDRAGSVASMMTNSSSPSSDTTSTCSEAASRSSDGWHSDEVEHATEALHNVSPVVAEAPVQSSDYIYEAALEFSDAVRAEVAHHYRNAFDAYKRGIAKLIEGARSDVRAEERRVAKDKISKYLARAEQIHDCYLSRDEMDGGPATSAPRVRSSTKAASESLELPLSELARYKVLKVVHSVMQVQDTGDRRIYIMKAIERPVHGSAFFPKNITNMVPLLGYFKSDTTIYLLLQQASGGRLWEYIETYHSTDTHPTIRQQNSLSSLFSEPHVDTEPLPSAPDIASSPETPFLEVLQQYRSSDYIRTDSEPKIGVSEFVASMEREAEIPAFDILSQNMDVLDLIGCSQKLIHSVSFTLEKTKIKGDDGDTTHETTVTDILLHQSARHADLARPNSHLQSTEPALMASPPESLRIKPMACIPERSIKRWAAELATAVHSLHAQNIVCQDLHPGKLLLGAKGEVQLTFFVRTTDRQLSAAAIDGLYVAPERPLTMLSDWWSFGVILFELLTGAPFEACHPGGIMSYYDIQYPDAEEAETNWRPVNGDARDLLELLIEMDISQRAGWSEVRQHRYFADVYWEE